MLEVPQREAAEHLRVCRPGQVVAEVRELDEEPPLPVVVLADPLAVALFEAGMIWYAGPLIDLMNDTGATAFWATHGTERVNRIWRLPA